MTISRSAEGVLVGTAAYMSPEQAAGKPVDRRADIWAFGAVLYEMVTGTRLIAGESIQELLVAILSREPSLDAVPPDVRPIVEKCLRKDPRRRWQSIGDVRLALEEGLTAVPARPVSTCFETPSVDPRGRAAAGAVDRRGATTARVAIRAIECAVCGTDPRRGCLHRELRSCRPMERAWQSRRRVTAGDSCTCDRSIRRPRARFRTRMARIIRSGLLTTCRSDSSQIER